MEKSRKRSSAISPRTASSDERSVHDALPAGSRSRSPGIPGFSSTDFHVDNLRRPQRRRSDHFRTLASVRTATTWLPGGRARGAHRSGLEASDAAIRLFRETLGPAPGFTDRLRRVALQRGWKAAGTFAKVCAEGRGGVYRRFLAPQLAAVEKNLARTGVECEFTTILRLRSAKLFAKEAPC
jgi:hypothetical protein